MNENYYCVINLLISKKTSETIRKLSDYADISDEDASNLIDRYQNILGYQARLSKYGMDNERIMEEKLKILNPLLCDEEKQVQRLVG